MEEQSPWQTSMPEQNQQNIAQYADQARLPELQEISWTASEFVSHQKSASWYAGLGAVAAVVTLIVFLLTRNILSSFVVAFAFMSLGIFAARQPQTVTYTMNEDGITVGPRFFDYDMFKSFSLVQDGAVNCIWLRPLKKYAPTTVIYYPPEEEDRILDTLENFLPEEDRQHDTIDKLSRKIRF
jgi:hypothetical protein